MTNEIVKIGTKLKNQDGIWTIINVKHYAGCKWYDLSQGQKDGSARINIAYPSQIGTNYKIIDSIDNEKLLDDLFDSLKNRELELSDNLPTWGSSPDCTLEIWSWSPTRMIIGSCANDIEIIDR